MYIIKYVIDRQFMYQPKIHEYNYAAKKTFIWNSKQTIMVYYFIPLRIHTYVANIYNPVMSYNVLYNHQTKPIYTRALLFTCILIQTSEAEIVRKRKCLPRI